MNRMEPGNRLLVDFLGIFTILTLRQWQIVTVLGLVLIVLSLIQKKGLRVWQGFCLASPFVMAAFFLGWFSPGGWAFAGITLLKLVVIVCWNSWIFASFTEMELIRGLRELCIPQIFTVTIFFIFRYRELLRMEMRQLRLAREIRGGRVKARFSLQDYRMLGQVMGAGLVRALDRGDRVYQAMRLRGLKVQTLVQANQQVKVQKSWLLITVVVAGCIMMVDRGGLFRW